ncbi:hypothetical protein CQW23_00418 [Capsicum baccatum]|uniref:Selenoprotein H n=1 Tax=Capsicum baccatum TaxID=33114 RepID=A0A2G2XKP4_CAPBA|nr:hypothetical protein CQW23_00418 [Capsicum baccatum]
MAPKRKQNMEQPLTTRAVRSSTRIANKPVLSDPEPPKPKRVKKANSEPVSADPEPAKRVNKENSVPVSADLKSPKANRGKKAVPEVKAGSKVVVVEHCTQCRQFKIRAVKVKEELEKGVPGLEVRVNPEKPRRGCFEIRVDGENGEKFISLLDMKRPFGPMKALDMDEVISGIIEKIK